MKILHAYAGIGGNRKHWDGETHDIVAVEKDPERAQIYRDHFPKDTVIETDAHRYIRDNHEDFDFIWSSPPCPTHSQIYRSGAKSGQYKPGYPGMELYQEIIFLKNFFDGRWVVENVVSYYEPLIEPVKSNKHYFWSNFPIPRESVDGPELHNEGRNRKRKYGFDLSGYDLDSKKRGKSLRNCVNPELGRRILASSRKQQQTLEEASLEA